MNPRERDDRRPKSVDVAVVGGGIVGLAAARAILEREPQARLCVLEKEATVGTHQTARNSGVVHAGIYYAPDSLKARLCALGRVALKEYTQERGIRYEECGKLIVARSESEVPYLEALYQRATVNGVPGVRLVSPEGVREIEPAVRGVAGLYSPVTAITDYRAIAESFASDIVGAGGAIRLNYGVHKIEQDPASVTVSGVDGSQICAAHVLVCAGLYGDRVATMAGDSADPRIVPFRGDYYWLAPDKAAMIRGLVYPVPDPAFPFLGVHLTKTVGGGVLVGPNAVLATAREGYRPSIVRLHDVIETLAWPGFRTFARRHWRVGLDEMRRAASRRRFASEAAAFMPGIGHRDLSRAPAGVRAQALDLTGRMVDDFLITTVGRVMSVRNAPSPAATSSIPIGRELASRLLDGSSAGGGSPPT